MEKLRPRESGNKFDNVAKNNPQALIAAIRNGDSDAFNAFCMGYGDSLIRVLTKILGNEEDAKDVTQDTFVLLWEGRERIDPLMSLKGYASTMAKNLAIDNIRAQGKRMECDADPYDVPHGFAEDADVMLISRETEILIAHAIRNMPAQRRRVFELSREEGLTHNEIAERLGISRNTVITHLNRAKEEIKSSLACALLLMFWV
jgi:RNA polymerase sigma-70 factor (ECF subfamily)